MTSQRSKAANVLNFVISKDASPPIPMTRDTEVIFVDNFVSKLFVSGRVLQVRFCTWGLSLLLFLVSIVQFLFSGRVARTLSYAEGAPSSGFEGGSWVWVLSSRWVVSR